MAAMLTISDKFYFFNIYFYLISMNVLPVCMTVHHVNACCPRRPEADNRFLDLSCESHVGAGNRVWVLWKSNRRSQPLGILSSPFHTDFLNFQVVCLKPNCHCLKNISSKLLCCLKLLYGAWNIWELWILKKYFWKIGCKFCSLIHFLILLLW